ncbi:MAG TPA: energy transducer TonB [Candidatus Udaeobacter sp.]|nr:energy transducer TonB [Candidatus Udaeobacter sp.]
MSTNPPSRNYGMASGRFWRNVTLIALAHVALIAGLIRWSLAARSAPDAESLIWLSGAEDIAARAANREAQPESKPSTPLPEPKSLKPDEVEEERPLLATAKSEIELSTPKPTPVVSFTPKPTPKPTTKPKPKPTPRKTVLAKASKSSASPKSNLPKSKGQQSDASNEKKKSTKTVSAKTRSTSDSGSGKTDSAGKGGSAGGSNPSEFGWYGNMLHDRFYSAWIQLTTTVASGAKISTVVKVRIEKDGGISKFEIIKPSENVVVNESVAAIAKRVTEVDPPPVGLGNGNHYDVKINFELNTNQETAR